MPIGSGFIVNFSIFNSFEKNCINNDLGGMVITRNGIIYKELPDGNLIVGTNETTIALDDSFKNTTAVLIPETVDGKKVIAVGQYAFYECFTIEYVYVKAKIKTIEFRAFDRLTALKEIHLPDSLEIIKMWAISGYHPTSGITMGTIKIFFEGVSQLKYLSSEAILNKETLMLFFCSKLSSVSYDNSITSYSNAYIFAPYRFFLGGIKSTISSHHCNIGVPFKKQSCYCSKRCGFLISLIISICVE